MTKTIAFATLAAALLPIAVCAAPKHKAPPAPTVYACQKCHMYYSTAEAKKDHYKDPMDGGALLPLKATAVKNSAPMSGMKM